MKQRYIGTYIHRLTSLPEAQETSDMTGQEKFEQIQQKPYNPSCCIPNVRIYLVILRTCMHVNARRSSVKGVEIKISSVNDLSAQRHASVCMHDSRCDDMMWYGVVGPRILLVCTALELTPYFVYPVALLVLLRSRRFPVFGKSGKPRPRHTCLLCWMRWMLRRICLSLRAWLRMGWSCSRENYGELMDAGCFATLLMDDDLHDWRGKWEGFTVSS